MIHSLFLNICFYENENKGFFYCGLLHVIQFFVLNLFKIVVFVRFKVQNLYFNWFFSNLGAMKAGGTITLLKGPSNIMVDTGSPWDKDVILKG